MKLYTIVAICTLLSLTGCSKPVPVTEQSWERFCPEESIPKRAEFVLQCVKNANPMSDEEPEDMVAECGHTAEKIFCPLTKVYVTRMSNKTYTRMNVSTTPPADSNE